MQVANHYFENGITHFTRRINKCISLGCANGEVAPFVGHNAFLRWSGMQDASFIDPADNKRKIWSEANVSEDFDMALRLLLKGYNLRWATYSNGGFKEGVSLTVVDELARWQKYAYGGSCSLFAGFATDHYPFLRLQRNYFQSFDQVVASWSYQSTTSGFRVVSRSCALQDRNDGLYVPLPCFLSCPLTN